MRRRSQSLRSRLIPKALVHLRARGVDVAALSARLGLPADAAAREEIRVTLASLRAFWEEAEQATGDAMFGLHLAQSFPRGSYGVPEFVGRHAPTVRDALASFVRYQAFLHDLPLVTLQPRAEGAIAVEHEVAGEPEGIGRHGNEFVVAALVRYCRELVGERVVPQRVWIAHAARGDSSELVRFLGTSDVDFGRGRNGLLLDAATLARPVYRADAALLPVLDSLAARVVPPKDEEGSLSSVRAQVRARLGDSPSLEGIASAVQVSARTLQRRLREASTTFVALVEDVRRETAIELLADERLGVGEVGARLGFAQPRTFSRAFKRWTGLTPLEYRRKGSGVD
jgi:AraC-like DNA-binding protein